MTAKKQMDTHKKLRHMKHIIITTDKQITTNEKNIDAYMQQEVNKWRHKKQQMKHTDELSTRSYGNNKWETRP